MATSSPLNSPARILAAILLIGAAVVFFSLFVPSNTNARSPDGVSRNHLPGKPIEINPDGVLSPVSASYDRSLGELVSKSYRIEIIAAHPEPLYTIRQLDGTILAEAITASDAALRFPSLPLLALPKDLVPQSSDSEPSVRDDLPLLSDTPIDDLHY